MWRSRKPVHNRSGAAMVEFAFCFPVFMTITLGMFEFGRAYMISHTCNAAARTAGRVAVTDVTTTDVIAAANDALSSSGYDTADFEVLVVDADDLDQYPSDLQAAYDSLIAGADPGSPYEVADAGARQLMIIRVQAQFQDVALFAPRWVSGNLILFGQAVVRKE